MYRLIRIKKERKALEMMLLNKQGSLAAYELYQALRPYFDKIDQMTHYYPIGRVRLARLFLESDLSDDQALFSCYGRFENLVEGVDVSS
ncbi:hypothetical protein [Celerinatantimonas sp. YJH-8]|uniref:hypothetical protein n=1 Tax=Celerinatantimonas sp. YJH-8 TaxID=3228714 RepID=UPI0038BF1C67